MPAVSESNQAWRIVEVTLAMPPKPTVSEYTLGGRGGGCILQVVDGAALGHTTGTKLVRWPIIQRMSRAAHQSPKSGDSGAAVSGYFVK